MLRKLGRVAVAVVGLGASAAHAREYTLLIYEAPQQVALRTDAGPAGAAYWAAFAAIGGSLAKSGVLRGGAALVPGSAETVGATAAEVGPTGYFIIDVPDLSTARTWATRIPAAATGRVEIREHAAAKTGM